MNTFLVVVTNGKETERRNIKAEKFYLTNDSALVFEDEYGNDLVAYNKDAWIVCSKQEDV